MCETHLELECYRYFYSDPSLGLYGRIASQEFLTVVLAVQPYLDTFSQKKIMRKSIMSWDLECYISRNSDW